MKIFLPSSCSLSSLDDGQTESSQSKYSNRGSRFHLGVVEHSSPTSGDTTAKKTHFAEVGAGVDLGRRDLCYHCVLGECGAAHEVEDLLAVLGERTGLGRLRLVISWTFAALWTLAKEMRT